MYCHYALMLFVNNGGSTIINVTVSKVCRYLKLSHYAPKQTQCHYAYNYADSYLTTNMLDVMLA